FFKILSRHKSIDRDPHFNFDWIMRLSEEVGLKSTFYFISGRTSFRYDSDYEIDDPRIIGLIEEILSRGHMIGLHPSFLSFDKPRVIEKELESLRMALKSNN